MKTKVCSKCGEEKAVTEFHKKGVGEGFRSECKKCSSDNCRKWRNKNPEKSKAICKEWRLNNPGMMAKYGKEWRKLYPNYDKIASKKWREKNAEYALARVMQWQRENPERTREIKRKSIQKKRATPKGRLNSNMASAVYSSLKKGMKSGRKWETLVGYTIDQLKKHLEKQFQPGMTWENQGSVWHIDHKIPIAAFNFETPDHIDFKRCWSLTNLRPLFAFDNYSKGAKLGKPFQPSFAF